jgi:hypothetical protein
MISTTLSAVRERYLQLGCTLHQEIVLVFMEMVALR